MSTHRRRLIFRKPTPNTPVDGEGFKFSFRTSQLLSTSLQNCLALSTSQNYSQIVSKFLRFCDAEGIPGDLRFPTPESVLCAFVASSAGQVAPSSAAKTVSALRAWHNIHGAEWKGSVRLHLVLNGVKNLAPDTSKKPPRLPIDIPMLSALINNLDTRTSLDCAVAACAATAFWGQCRLGELLPDSTTGVSMSRLPMRHHLRNPVSATDTPASLFLPTTKTKKHGDSVILLAQEGPTDALKLLQNHLRRNKLAANDMLFSYRTHQGLQPLTRRVFMRRCNEIWDKLGYPHTTGHSFRIGGTTELLVSGVPPDVVKMMGRWTSDAFLKYWRRVERIAPLYAENISKRARKRKRRNDT